jgi:hypothetical protein
VVAEAAEGLAAVAGTAGDFRLAARLLGVASTLRQAMQADLLRSLRPHHDDTVAAVTEALGGEEAERALAEGAALSLHEFLER